MPAIDDLERCVAQRGGHDAAVDVWHDEVVLAHHYQRGDLSWCSRCPLVLPSIASRWFP